MAGQTPRYGPHETDLDCPVSPTPGRRSPRCRIPGLLLLLVALGVLLSACDVTRSEPERPRAPVCAAGQIDGELVLMSRADQISPDAIYEFERRYGIDVVGLEYDSEDDLLARVTAGADDFDVLVVPDYLAETLRRGDTLYPLDPIALPGRVNLDPMFAGPSVDSEPLYSIPLVWGTVGMGVNLNMVGKDVDPSWGLLFDTYQAWIFAGRMSLLEEGRQVMAAAMLYLGHSPNLDDQRRVAEAAALVADARAFLRGFDSEDYASDLVEGGLDVAHGRSDLFLAALPPNSGDFRYIIPREGAVVWLDMLVVPITSRHPCTAHSFIDFVLEPRIGAEVANYTGVATPNLMALEHVLPELVFNPLIYPPPNVRSRLEMLDYSEDLNRLYGEEFIYSDPS